MSNKEIHTCPKCGMNDQVGKVSTIYLQGLGARKTSVAQPMEGQPRELSKAEVSKLRRLLAPPSSGKSQVTRPIHPDLILLVFTGVLPVFLIGIASSQSALFLPAILIMAVFYLLYFWQRKRLVGRYHQLKQSQAEEMRRVERAIGHWMRAYYCARDKVVFENGDDDWIPVERAEVLLWKEM